MLKGLCKVCPEGMTCPFGAKAQNLEGPVYNGDRRLPEGGLAEGFLDLAENRSFSGSGRPRRAFKPSKTVGGFAPHPFRWFKSPPGAVQIPKATFFLARPNQHAPRLLAHAHTDVTNPTPRQNKTSGQVTQKPSLSFPEDHIEGF